MLVEGGTGSKLTMEDAVVCRCRDSVDMLLALRVGKEDDVASETGESNSD